MFFEYEENEKFTPEKRIREVLAFIIMHDGRNTNQLKNYYTDEFKLDFNSTSTKVMFERDLKSLVKHKIVFLENGIYTINKNFNFEGDVYTLAGIYTMFYFGFMKNIIRKDYVVQFFNPSLYEEDEIEKLELELERR